MSKQESQGKNQTRLLPLKKDLLVRVAGNPLPNISQRDVPNSSVVTENSPMEGARRLEEAKVLPRSTHPMPTSLIKAGILKYVIALGPKNLAKSAWLFGTG